MLDHCLQDLADYRKLMIAECGEVIRALRRNPELMIPLRRRLARVPGIEAQSWPDRQVLDYFSTVTLQRRYDDLTSLTQAYGRLTVVQRLRRIDLIDRFWSKDLRSMEPLMPVKAKPRDYFMIFHGFLYDAMAEADLRFLITTLALQHGARGGTLPTPQGALKALGISEEAGMDPFTDEPFQVKWVAPDRVELLGVPLPLRKELAIDHYRIERTSKEHPQPYSFPIVPVK